MRIEERTVDSVAVIEMHGDIVLNGPGPDLADRVRSLLEHDRRHILLDVGDVRYVDSGGVGALIASLAAARHRGGSLKLLDVPKRLSDLLAVTKLSAAFECFETEAEAIASFGHAPTAQGAAARQEK